MRTRWRRPTASQSDYETQKFVHKKGDYRQQFLANENRMAEGLSLAPQMRRNQRSYDSLSLSNLDESEILRISVMFQLDFEIALSYSDLLWVLYRFVSRYKNVHFFNNQLHAKLNKRHHIDTFRSFSAVSAPIFATKYAFFSIFQNLPDYLAENFET